MSRVIDLTAERRRRDAPDPQHVRRDDHGRPLYRYEIAYQRADGRPYGVEVWAYDWADAEAAAAGLSAGCTVVGQIMSWTPR